MLHETDTERSSVRLSVPRWQQVVGFVIVLTGLVNFCLWAGFGGYIPVPFYRGVWQPEVSAIGYLLAAIVIHILLARSLAISAANTSKRLPTDN